MLMNTPSAGESFGSPTSQHYAQVLSLLARYETLRQASEAAVARGWSPSVLEMFTQLALTTGQIEAEASHIGSILRNNAALASRVNATRAGVARLARWIATNVQQRVPPRPRG